MGAASFRSNAGPGQPPSKNGTEYRNNDSSLQHRRLRLSPLTMKALRRTHIGSQTGPFVENKIPSRYSDSHTHTSCTIPYSNTEPTYVGDITTQPPPIHPSKRTVMCTAKRRLICDGHAFNAPPTRARFSCSGGDVKYKFPHFIPSPSCVHQ